MGKANFITHSKASLLIALVFMPLMALAQQTIIINLAPIDGIPITPRNIFNYQVQSSDAGKVDVKGTIRYRSSGLSLTYTFPWMMREGLNTFSSEETHPQWQFSSSALRELFFNYNVLPEGTFEYCVTITPATAIKENSGNVFEECLYYRANGVFLINLIHPENNSKLKEYNPMLAWVANYSFSNELTYRLRVAEIKEGQNTVTAIMRNQPMYSEGNLMQNSQVYPVFAKPLEANKYYAWTVDAYYKDILLGGAEAWKFIIPNDTLPAKYVPNRSYIDIRRENGTTQLYVVGSLKIKYLLEKTKADELSLRLVNEGGKDMNVTPGKLKARYGDNRYELKLDECCSLKHLNTYRLEIATKNGEHFSLPFKYLNPDFVE